MLLFLNSKWQQIRKMVEITWIAAVRSLVAKVFALDQPRSRKVPSTRLEKAKDLSVLVS